MTTTASNMEQVFSNILLDFINQHEEIGYDIITELNRFDQYITGRRNPVALSGIDNLNEPDVNVQFVEESNIDRLLMEYADYSWNNCDQPTYTCKLCTSSARRGEKQTTLEKVEVKEEQVQFTTLDQFLKHLRRGHVENINEEQKQYSIDRQCEQLWVGELEKMKQLEFKYHSDEFMKEIDEILGNEDFDMTAILNSLDIHDDSRRGIAFNAKDLTITDLLTAASANGASSPTSSHASSSSSSSSASASSSSSSSTPSNSSDCSKPVKKKKKRTSGQCDVCNRTFNDLYNLRIHKMIHTGEKPFQCSECGKRFRQYNKLKIHCITHTDEKPFICEICGKGFRFRNYLSVHKRLHSGENPYKCKYCNEFFHSLHSRRLHTKMMHCEAKTYTCPICDKVLTAQCYLTAHIKRHTNQRDYKCETCDKCFFSQSQLKDHQLVHTNLKPYQCSVCYARFQRKSNYTQHLKIHTGEKTYVCHICFKSFAQNAGLYGHMKSHAKCD